MQDYGLSYNDSPVGKFDHGDDMQIDEPNEDRKYKSKDSSLEKPTAAPAFHPVKESIIVDLPDPYNECDLFNTNASNFVRQFISCAEQQTPHPEIEILITAFDLLIRMVEQLLSTQKNYETKYAPFHVDIGYHHTSSKNLDSIRNNGLLLRRERQQQNITSQFNGDIHGDGIYCASDPILHANQRYGDTTLMLIRIKGIEANSILQQSTHYDTLNVSSKGCSVLQSSNQCVPLFKFPSRLLGKPGGFDRKLAEFHQEVQGLLDTHFNNGHHTKFEDDEFPLRVLPPPSFFRVRVPEGVRPGEKFQAYAGNKIVTVGCPQASKPGEYVPFYYRTPDSGSSDGNVDTNNAADPNHVGSIGSNDKLPKQTVPPANAQVKRIADTEPPAYVVTIPAGIAPGTKFPVNIQGQMLLVTCPVEAGPGKFVKIVPPKPDVPQKPDVPPSSQDAAAASNHNANQMFEVRVPEGVLPNHPFQVMVGGKKVRLICPPTASVGQKIRFKMPPSSQQQQPQQQFEQKQPPASGMISDDEGDNHEEMLPYTQTTPGVYEAY